MMDSLTLYNMFIKVAVLYNKMENGKKKNAKPNYLGQQV